MVPVSTNSRHHHRRTTRSTSSCTGIISNSSCGTMPVITGTVVQCIGRRVLLLGGRRRRSHRGRSIRQRVRIRTTGSRYCFMVRPVLSRTVFQIVKGSVSESSVRLCRHDRRRVRFPVWGHHRCYGDARGRVVVWRAARRGEEAAGETRVPEQLCVLVLGGATANIAAEAKCVFRTSWLASCVDTRTTGIFF